MAQTKSQVMNSTTWEEQNEALLARLNRVQGQIEGLKKKIGEEPSAAKCKATMQQVKAANNALRKFAEAYVDANMQACFEDKHINMKDLREQMQDVIASAFTL